MIDRAVIHLKQGKIVAIPTETVYGLAAPVFSPEAVEKIFRLKKRPIDNPLIVHISSFDQLDQIVEFYPEKLVRTFWPGPLTLILPKKPSVPSIVSAGLSTIGVRMPNHPLALELIERVGEPLVAPSANLSGKPSSTCAKHVYEDFQDQIMILDGGPCSEGLESTVLSLDPLSILRPGIVTAEALEEILAQKIDQAPQIGEKPLSPGTKYKHYAPKAKIQLVENLDSIHESPNRWILHHIEPEMLYANFREADRQGIKEIVIHCNEKMRKNPALMNRLMHAAQIHTYSSDFI